MTEILVIDDERTFAELPSARYARTPQEAIEALSERSWDEVWWDHDLGEAGDSMEIVSWMEQALSEYADACDARLDEMLKTPLDDQIPARPDEPFHIKASFVHSMNPVGAARIQMALTRMGDHAVMRVELPEVVDAVPPFVQP